MANRDKHLPVKAAADCPVSVNEEVHSCKQQHHGHWIIKETQDEDGVDAIRCATHKEEDVGRNLKNIMRAGGIRVPVLITLCIIDTSNVVKGALYFINMTSQAPKSEQYIHGLTFLVR